MNKRGMAAARQRMKEREQAKAKGLNIAANDFAHLEKQMANFTEKLQKFSFDYKDKIKKDPVFRTQFTQMCASLGVDPLASSKSAWGSMTGVGDFYYELAVQAIEICMATRAQNGGLMSLDELYSKLVTSRGPHKDKISKDDLIQALKNLKVLGSGFSLIKTGKRYLVQSIPSDMSEDPGKILSLAEEQNGVISIDILVTVEGWARERAENVLTKMLHSSQAWLDTDQYGNTKYWFPSLLQV